MKKQTAEMTAKEKATDRWEKDGGFTEPNPVPLVVPDLVIPPPSPSVPPLPVAGVTEPTGSNPTETALVPPVQTPAPSLAGQSARPKPAKMKAVVATYETHQEAEEAVRELQRSGFDMRRLSIVGKDYRTEEEVVGYYNTGDRMKAWGKSGAFWGGIWGLLCGSAFFLVPGIGALLSAGPLVGWMVGALEGAVIVGGMGVLGASLYGMGIPEDSVIEYESRIKAGKFIVILHGSPAEVSQTREILLTTRHEGLEEHPGFGPPRD